MQSFRYKAFISYSHKDQAAAKWLHHSLENYRAPGKLHSPGAAGRNRYPLRPVFRDQEELVASADLSDSILTALAASEFLVVLCSPHAANSRWVNQEIISFRQMHPAKQVLALIVDGQPGGQGSGTAGNLECFPPALRFDTAPDGQTSEDSVEPLAADLRPGGDGKRLAMLKIAAAMLGVGLDELVQRDTQQRYRILSLVTGGAVSAMVLMGWLTYTAMSATSAAEFRRHAAEDLVEFMLGDLRKKLEPVGRLEVMDAIGEKALAYYDAQEQLELDADSLGRRARALHLIGEIHDIRGDSAAALEVFQRAAKSTGALLQIDSSNTQRVFDHAQSVFWVGYIAYQRGENDTVRQAFQQYLDLARQLVATEPDNPDWQAELGYAYGNLGTMAFEEHQWKQAEQAFKAALSVSQTLAELIPGDPDRQHEIAVNHAWLASTYLKQGNLDQALHQNLLEISIYKSILETDAENRTAQRQLLLAQRGRAELALSAGDTDTAIQQLLSARQLATSLSELEPDSTVIQEQVIATQRDLGENYLLTGHYPDSRQALMSCTDKANQLIDKDATVLLWRIDYLDYCRLHLSRLLIREGTMDDASKLLADVIEDLETLTDSGTMLGELPWVHASAYLDTGDLLDRQGDHTGARRHWEKARQILDGDLQQMEPKTQALLAATLFRLQQHDRTALIIRTLELIGYKHPAYVEFRDAALNQGVIGSVTVAD